MSAPGYSWQPNRLDVFVRETDEALYYHKWWDGLQWSEYENLGVVLTSAPAAMSSRMESRIHVLSGAPIRPLIYKWWDGRQWNDWESLGGVLTSDPAVSSRRSNQLDVFVRGTDNGLYKKTWNGTRWKDWENLGSSMTSEPAAVSWTDWIMCLHVGKTKI